ncbi:hypothetical protein [Dendronalium sp. ChiSLP03b]|nr:hypothetical protein [Dendronalium sp. ChiSLP03b]MDZ8206555.1 hypothetical protein [Dendronalium sp. ChiSLP03b]
MMQANKPPNRRKHLLGGRYQSLIDIKKTPYVLLPDFQIITNKIGNKL